MTEKVVALILLDLSAGFDTVEQGQLNNMIGPRAKQCTGGPLPTQPLTGIKM